MDLMRLIAVVLLATAIGCSPSRLFSRADPEADFQLDPRDVDSAAAQTAPAALKGNGNVVQSPAETPEGAMRPRSLDGLPVSELLARAELARKQQQLPEARRHLEAILLQHPAHPGAHHQLAVISDLEGRFGDAEHHYKMALHADGHNALITGDLGYSYMLQGRLPLAEQFLLQARRLDPADGYSARNLAQLYSRRGDLESARRVLADVHSPAEVEQQLAQLFPGVSLQHTHQPPLNVPAGPGSAPADPAFAVDAWTAEPDQTPVVATQYAMTASDHRAAMVGKPGFAPEPPSAGSSQFASTQPNVAARGAAEQISFDSEPLTAPPVEQAVAADSTSAGNPGAQRRWPPPLWPPESPSPAVSTTTGTVSHPAVRPKAGVNYLLPRRSPIATTPLIHPAPPASNFPRDMPPQGAPTGAIPFRSSADTSGFQSPAQYATGPGSSRIVTWSNLNGQSIDPPPLPSTDEELRAAAALGLGGGTPHPSAAMRTSSESASGWNGGHYPAPQRELPGNSSRDLTAPPVYQLPPTTAATPNAPSARLPAVYPGH